MRLFRRENGIWYAEIRRNVKRSLKTTDEREAKIQFKRLERDILNGRLLLDPDSRTMALSKFLQEYKDYVKKNRAYNTYERVSRIIKKVIDGIGDKPINALKYKDLDNYIDYCRGKGNSPETINIEIRHIKAALSQAVKWEYIKTNPFKGYSLLKYHKKKPNFIESVEDIEKIFSVIEQSPNPRSRKIYKLVFALYIYTGARRSEIWKLEWGDIKQDTIVFRERKNYEMLEIPIVPKLREILDQYDRSDGKVIPLSLDQIGRRIKYYLRKAGLGHLRPHDLRHTFASHLLMSGVDIETVRRLLGQTSLVATKTYSHILDSHKKEAIKNLPY